MIPQYDAEELTDVFFTRWSEALMEAAKYELYKQPRKPYTDLNQAQVCLREYMRFVADAKKENFRDGKTINDKVNMNTARGIWGNGQPERNTIY